MHIMNVWLINISTPTTNQQQLQQNNSEAQAWGERWEKIAQNVV